MTRSEGNKSLPAMAHYLLGECLPFAEHVRTTYQELFIHSRNRVEA